MVLTEWKTPLTLSVALHLLLFSSIVYLPDFLKGRPKLAKIQTISIVSLPDTASPSPAVATPPGKTITPEVTKRIAPNVIPVEKNVKAASSPKKAVSLHPRKKKLIKKKKRVNKQKSDQQRIQREKQRRLEAAKREQNRLEEEARRAAEDLKREQQLLSSTPVAQPGKSSKGSPLRGRSSSSNLSLLENRYFASITGRILQFWALPEYMQQKSNLSATVVVTVNRDGTVANMFFEQKSGNQVFDQFVRRTLEQASPLPPIPAALKKQRIEIGLNFSPGGIR